MNTYDSLIEALDQLRSHADELRDLDGVLGDGDLGVTVSEGAAAIQAVLREAGPETTLSRLLMEAGRAFGNANPSTFAALTQGGLLAAAKATKERKLPLTAADLATILRAGAESIATRGGASPGDKTVLDPILRSIEVLERENELTSEVLGRMADAAVEITDELAARPSARGRAAWVGERSVGHRDPGSVAYIRLLEALRDHTAVKADR